MYKNVKKPCLVIEKISFIMLTDSVGQEFKMVQQGWILFAFCSLGP